MYESIVNSKYVCHQKNCRLDLSQKVVRCLTYLKISCAKKTDAFGSTTIETTTRRF